MASSFSTQIHVLLYLISKVEHNRILDIGKGFGKYGFLIHEYIGIDPKAKIDPSKSLRQLSKINIDAVEVDKDLLFQHLNQFYNNIFFGNILEIYKDLKNYDLILMIDVIEHLPKEDAIKILKYFIENGQSVIVATPNRFFEQNLYESDYEKHISFWKKKDFINVGNVLRQKVGSGTIYFVSKEKVNIRGFGDSLFVRIKRFIRFLLDYL